MQHHVLWHLLLWGYSSENWRDTGMAREVLTGIRLSSLCPWATIRAFNSYCHLMDQCCLETLWSTSGSQFPADKHSQHKASLGMAVVCIPSTKLRNAEAWILPTMWAGCSRTPQQQGKTFLAIPTAVYKADFCLQDRQLSTFYNTLWQYLHLLCGPGYRSKNTKQSIWHWGLDPHSRASQGVLIWTNPVDWTSPSSRRAVLECFFALVPCLRKPADKHQGCSATSTKTEQVGTVSVNVCFRPK